MPSPIVFSVRPTTDVDPATPAALAAQYEVVAAPHPALVAILDPIALRRGDASWQWSKYEGTANRRRARDRHVWMAQIAAAFPGSMRTHDSVTSAAGNAPVKMDHSWQANDGLISEHRSVFPGGASGNGIISIEDDGPYIRVRVYTHFIDQWSSGVSERRIDPAPFAVDQRAAGRGVKAAPTVDGVTVLALRRWLMTHYQKDGGEMLTGPVTDAAYTAPASDHVGTELVNELYATSERSVIVLPVPGAPARATATVGELVPRDVRRIAGLTTTASAAEVDADTVAALDCALGADVLYVDTLVRDVARMAAAAPYPDERLHDYQQELVGRWLASERGIGNFCAPGAGKTPTTLAGFGAAASTTPAYRAIVVVEANVRFQWVSHAHEWLPGFTTVLVDSRKKLNVLRESLAAAGDSPVLVITSYALASAAGDVVDADAAIIKARKAQHTFLSDGYSSFDGSAEDHRAAAADHRQIVADTVAARDALTPDTHLGAALLDVAWHDIAVDEAKGLRSPSKTGRALWALRAVTGRAAVLTGTPIERTSDDVAALMAWVFADRNAWRGVKPTSRYDLSKSEDAAAFLADLGPTVFRRDKSEIGVALPNLTVEVVPLTLRREELALAQAARTQLAEKYRELVAALDLAAADTDDVQTAETLAEAAAAMRTARTAWFGSTTLARQAAADPAAVEASQTAGAEVLRLNGLVAAACALPGTKRRWAGEYTAAAVDAGMQVVLFTEFATVARALLDDFDDAGINAGAVLGGGGKKRDADVLAFQRGEIDVLVCTSAGERGLNLQTRHGAGQVLVHLDLPWTASGVVQRTGRVERIGGADNVHVVFPVASGTIEDRVAGLVCARAMASLQALDAPRGIRMQDTDFGRALGSLAAGVDVTAVAGSDRALLEMTRAVLAA
jgi:hypothetical protein